MMRWLYKVLGTHTHVKCYMNGALCGTLIFRNDEFARIRSEVYSTTGPERLIEFVKEEG